MSHPTLLLHLGIHQSNEGRLAVARDLADRLNAAVIGAAACDPQPPPYFEDIYPVEVVKADRSFAREQLDAAEADFRRALRGREDLTEWRGALAPPALHVLRQCRSADLVITGATAPELMSDPNWRLDPGDLVMQAGRPVLVVPEDYARRLAATALVIGWKDSREARRAVADALPLARLAERVLVATIAETATATGAEAGAGAANVVAWFGRHGIRAEGRCQPLVSDPASQLRALALDEGADVIVAGAYGHTRTREWVLGGVTRELLTGRTGQCLLLSH